MSTTAAHYAALYADLQREVGTFDDDALTGIVGFSAGGPVSMVRIPGKSVYVTCELSLYQEQVPSSEGLRYEFLCRIPIPEAQMHRLLTVLGNLSMEAKLGHDHTVDVADASGVPGLSLVVLKHHSSARIGKATYGIYEIVAAQHEA